MEYIIVDRKVKHIKDRVQIQSLFKDYGHFFQDIHGKKGTNLIRSRGTTCMDDTIKCKSGKLGFATFACTHCGTKKIVNFTCKRRFCSSCSKPLCDKFINNIRERLPTNISYIHITFTLPEELRDFWLQYRHTGILNVIFQEATAILNDFFLEKFGIKPGIFSVIHTFGSHVNRNPHLHLVATLGGIFENSEGIDERMDIQDKYLSFRAFKKRWRTLIIKKCRKMVSKEDPQNYDKWSYIFQKLFKKSRYVKLSDPIIDVVKIMNYVTRYMYRAPVSIAKIIDAKLTGDPHNSTITIRYIHKKPREVRTVTYSVFDFLGMILRQLPDKYFRTIRYYGLFAQNTRKINIQKIHDLAPKKQLTQIEARPTKFIDRAFDAFGVNPLSCPNCSHEMTLQSITYFSKRTRSFTTKYFDSG